MSEHLYKIGETVMILPAFGTRSGPAKIVRLLPASRDDSEPQYRVKSNAENYERMMPQSGIMVVK